MTTDLAPKRVLVVAYVFPPVGGAGVQRVTKFVKYLPRYRWLPSVLTVANPSVPVFDRSLGAEIPRDTILRYARSREPGYGLKKAVSGGSQKDGRHTAWLRRWMKALVRGASNLVLQPDSQILWWPEAVREGMRLLGEIQHDAIFVTAPPFSSLLVGASLSRRTGLPLILDYRDEWGISNKYWENKLRDPVSGWLQSRMQRNVMRAASALVATTRASAESLEQIARQAGADVQVTSIYNGFDSADLRAVETALPHHRQRYRLAYVGTLWNLTSVEPLVRAVETLAAEELELAGGLELVFTGRRTAPQDEWLDRLDRLPCRVIRQSYLDHSGVIELMHAADGLCLLLSDVPHAGRVVPAKVFEYLAVRRPIVSITPPGEVSELLGECPFANIHTPRDIRGIAQTLAREIRRFRDGTRPEFPSWDVSQFDRQNLTGELAGLLDLVTCAENPTTSTQLAAV